MASKGTLSADIADVVGRKERTVILWLRDWNNRRFASMFTGHKDNTNAGKLTPEQKAKIHRPCSYRQPTMVYHKYSGMFPS
jgi:hypothetical protein